MANEEISVVGMNIAKMATMIWNVADMLRGFCVKQFLELHSVGTTMQNFNTTIVSNNPIVYGTTAEQKQIVEHIDSTICHLDSLIKKKIQSLSEMEFYKTSLIFEYVTGKKEVSL